MRYSPKSSYFYFLFQLNCFETVFPFTENLRFDSVTVSHSSFSALNFSIESFLLEFKNSSHSAN